MRFCFIEDHRNAYPVRTLCAVLEVSPSGYYAWRDRPESARHVVDRGLTAEIRQIHADNRAVYGSPRVHAALRAGGRRVSVNRVARLMRHHGIQGRHKRRAPRTTDSHHSHPIAPNLLDRQFTATAPNRVWLADITYIPTREGWLYLAVVLDMFSRRGGLGDARYDATRVDDRRATDGDHAASARSWVGASFRPWGPIRSPRLPALAGPKCDPVLDEP